jgi:Fur family iron response transcriptional regulator
MARTRQIRANYVQMADTVRQHEGRCLMQRAEIMLEFERHGILPTSQRLEVAEVLLEKPQHLSAEQIIEKLRARGSGVSKATVYNTLNLFGERGLVGECLVDPERRYYDSNRHPHHHFFDVDTGELTDIPRDQIRFAEMPDFPGEGSLDSIEVLIKVRSKPPENLG